MKKISALLMRLALVATLALLAVPALAQDMVFTGCIRSADGSLYNVREGTAPMKPCRAKDKQISWNMAGQPGPPGPPGPSLPPSLEIDVNCDTGESINAALGQQAERLTISISGTCVERVWIARNDVTLQGIVGTNPTIMAPAGAGGAIAIIGAQRVHLQGLAVTGGPDVSLEAGDGASFTAYQLKISNPAGGGLTIGNGSSARIEESEIAGNGTHGAGADSGSSLILRNTQVIDNAKFGVAVQTSALRLSGRTNVARNGTGVYMRNARAVGQGGCTIVDNRGGGVSAEVGSHLFLEQCRIAGNGGSGIGVYGTSAAELAYVVIQNNTNGGVSAAGGSSVSVGGASIVDGGTAASGIRLGDTCTGSVGEDVSITGSPYGIECAPPPSVAQLVCCTPSTVTTNCLTDGL
jgi:hypothetical protein